MRPQRKVLSKGAADGFYDRLLDDAVRRQETTVSSAPYGWPCCHTLLLCSRPIQPPSALLMMQRVVACLHQRVLWVGSPQIPWPNCTVLFDPPPQRHAW